MAQHYSTRSITLQAPQPQADYQTTIQWVRHMLNHTAHSHLIVDTFPRGLGGELSQWLPHSMAIKVLIHRDLNPVYVETMNLLPFIATHYDHVLVPGDGYFTPFVHLPRLTHTPPWLIRSASELFDRATLATQYHVDIEKPVIIVLAAGQADELAWYGRVTAAIAHTYPDVMVRCIAPHSPPHCPSHLWLKHFPAMELLPLADLVIGGGGYNTVNECQALGIPLIARPVKRRYDRQQDRLQRWRSPHVRISHDLDDVLHHLDQFLQTRSSHSSPIDFINGALVAYRIIVQQANTNPTKGLVTE